MRARIVGAKNMHSSSGWAVIRSTRPVGFRELSPLNFHQRSTQVRISNSNVTKQAKSTEKHMIRAYAAIENEVNDRQHYKLQSYVHDRQRLKLLLVLVHKISDE